MANYTINPKADDERRLEVIQWLAEWGNPPARDKVSARVAPHWKQAQHSKTLNNRSSPSLENSLKAQTKLPRPRSKQLGALGLDSIGPELLALSKSTTAKTSTRIAALNGLYKLQNPKLSAALASLAAKPDKLDSELLTVVASLTAKRDETAAMPLVEAALKREEQSVKQSAIATLGTMTNAESSKILADAIQKMIADKYPQTLRLDVIMAAKQRNAASLNDLLSKYNATRNKRDADPLVAANLDVTMGGDLERGKDVFYNKTATSCLRCHKIGWDGGNVGPALTDLGAKHDRRYIIEAIANPNKVIAKGYGELKVLTEDGKVVTGVLKEETDDQIVLIDSQGNEIVIDQETVEETKPGLSSMPTNLHEQLSPVEFRDLVEFLANQKGETEPEDAEEVEPGHKQN